MLPGQTAHRRTTWYVPRPLPEAFPGHNRHRSVTPINRAALAAPIAVRPNQDLLHRAAQASRFSPPCEGRALPLSPCGCSARIFRGPVSPTLFFLRVRYIPPWHPLPIRPQMTVIMVYSVVPRRPTTRTPACRTLSDPASFMLERAPCPNPRLAMEDTACRIDSMEAGSLPSEGADSPSSSHRIFGFRVGVRFRFFDCMLLINAVLFMAISPSGDVHETSAPPTCSFQHANMDRSFRADTNGLSPGKPDSPWIAAHAGETKTIRARTVTGRKARDVPLVRSVGYSTTRNDQSPIPSPSRSPPALSRIAGDLPTVVAQCHRHRPVGS